MRLSPQPPLMCLLVCEGYCVLRTRSCARAETCAGVVVVVVVVVVGSWERKGKGKGRGRGREGEGKGREGGGEGRGTRGMRNRKTRVVGPQLTP